MSRLRSGCPAEDCKAANPRQDRIDASKLAEAGATGDWLSSGPLVCTYCGCVYTQAGVTKVIRGWYDSMLGNGWRPTTS